MRSFSGIVRLCSEVSPKAQCNKRSCCNRCYPPAKLASRGALDHIIFDSSEREANGCCMMATAESERSHCASWNPNGIRAFQRRSCRRRFRRPGSIGSHRPVSSTSEMP